VPTPALAGHGLQAGAHGTAVSRAATPALVARCTWRWPGAVALLLLLPVASAATSQLGRYWALHCHQPSPRALSCDYRPLQAGPPARLSATWEETELDTRSEPYPGSGARSAAVFLVDTSDPRRGDVVRANAAQIRAMVARAAAHHVLGLAGFDKSMQLYVPLGEPNDTIPAATTRLVAKGKTTELYRSALQAIDLLALEQAERKALYLFSDGLAEDTAYALEDVVVAARRENVSIVGLGFARSVALSVGLQSLRKLSEQSGGFFVEADAAYNLPQDFLLAPFALLDTGGRVEIDLGAAVEAGAADSATLTLRLDNGELTEALRIEVQLPPPPPPEPPAVPAPAPVQPSVPRPAAPPAPMSQTTSTALLALLLGLLLLLAALSLLLARMYRARSAPHAEVAVAPAAKPYAYLTETQGEEFKVHPVTRTPWRMGRGANNDLVIDENSISRHHAEIVHEAGGTFRLLDLGSLNGVFVNGEKVKEVQLQTGDQVELGEVHFNFSLDDPGQLPEGETIYIDTRMPPGEL